MKEPSASATGARTARIVADIRSAEGPDGRLPAHDFTRAVELGPLMLRIEASIRSIGDGLNV
ncbi:MAG: hypothetical protein ACRDZP_09295 [Acidimicrobiales bacterium]